MKNHFKLRLLTITLFIITIVEGVVIYNLKTNPSIQERSIKQLGATARLYKDQLDEYSKRLDECRKLSNDLKSSNLACSEELRKLKSK